MQIRISKSLGTKDDLPLGGPGSGNWAHAGRPGKRGGSQQREGGMTITKGKDWLDRYEQASGRKHPLAVEIEAGKQGSKAERIKEVKAALEKHNQRLGELNDELNMLPQQYRDKKINVLEYRQKVNDINAEIDAISKSRNELEQRLKDIEAEKDPVDNEAEKRILTTRRAEIEDTQAEIGKKLAEIEQWQKDDAKELRGLKKKYYAREITVDQYFDRQREIRTNESVYRKRKAELMAENERLAKEKADIDAALNPPKKGGAEAAQVREKISKIGEELSQLSDKRDAAEKAFINLHSKFVVTVGDEREKLRPEYDKALRERKETAAAYHSAWENTRAEILDTLKVDNPISIDVRYGSKFDSKDSRAQAITDGVRIFSSLTNVTPDVRSDVIFRKAGSGRASASADGTTINLTAHSGVATVIHELGHWLEDNSISIRNRVLAFYQRRTAGEATITMNTAVRQAGQSYGGYRSNEVTRVDKFIHPYMGKLYRSGGKQYATEILSMGMQMFFEDPVKLARQDPEYFDFIYTVIRGMDL